MTGTSGKEARLTTDDLQGVGFVWAAHWVTAGEHLAWQQGDPADPEIRAALSVDNALYAFATGDEVLYIGKTTRSLNKRLRDYCKPGARQRTNIKCNANIKAALGSGRAIDVLIFAPPSDLQFRGFEINLAGGLEDILIRRFDPPWNGREKGHVITESAAIEAEMAEAEERAPSSPTEASETGRFTITLGKTYYTQGIVNPEKAVDHLFGPTDGRLTVRFSDGTPSVATRIDRRARRSGAVRLIGSNQAIADWFQKHFAPGDSVTAIIRGPNEIEFLA